MLCTGVDTAASPKAIQRHSSPYRKRQGEDYVSLNADLLEARVFWLITGRPCESASGGSQ